MHLSKRQCNLLFKELYRNMTTERQQKLALRNVTMASLMLHAGLRTTEVVNLTISDLSIADMPLSTLTLVRGIPKGHRRRTIALNEKVRHCIGLMNEFWWRLDSEKPGYFAFYDESPIRHITATQFRRIISKAGMSALNYPVRPNMLRRTCAVMLLKSTDRKTVQDCLDYKTDQDSYFY